MVAELGARRRSTSAASAGWPRACTRAARAASSARRTRSSTPGWPPARCAARCARRPSPRATSAASCFLAAGLCFRSAWVGAGPPSARDDEAVALMARARGMRHEPDAGPVEVARPG